MSNDEREDADHEKVYPDGRSQGDLWREREIVDGVTADFEEQKNPKKEKEEAAPSFTPLSHAVREMLWDKLAAKGDPIAANIPELTEALLTLAKGRLIRARRRRRRLHGNPLFS